MLKRVLLVLLVGKLQVLLFLVLPPMLLYMMLLVVLRLDQTQDKDRKRINRND